MHELHGDKLEALLFKTLDDITDKSALDPIGLDHDEGPLLVGFGGHDGIRFGTLKAIKEIDFKLRSACQRRKRESERRI